MTTALSTPASRVSALRVLVVLGATVAVLVGGVLAVRPLVSSASAAATPRFAPYVDLTATPTYRFETPATPLGQDVTLAFVVADRTTPCVPSWGGHYTLDQADSNLEVTRRIAQLRSTGGDVRVSFGGQANQELAVACTDVRALEAAYGSVVTRYALTGIDLDLEGAALTGTAAQARRAAAVRAVQQSAVAAGRTLAVWLTLPVGVDGLTEQGVAAVSTVLAAGVDIAGVNGMTMDFGGSKGRLGTADAVVAASKSLQAQVRSVFGRAGTTLSDTEAWTRTGITPMIGQSDVVAERLTVSDAAAVNSFARSVGVGLVSMWSLNRDGTCKYPLPDVVTVVQTSCSGVDQGGVSFTSVLGRGLDGLPVASPTSAATSSADPVPSVTDDAATSPFPIWDALTPYPGGTKVVWHHSVYEAGYWTTGVAPDASVGPDAGTPWVLLGPVLPGDTPAPVPSASVGTYPQWQAGQAYPTGSRVLVGTVPYVARFWSQGQQPGVPVAGGSPWKAITDAG